MKHEEPEREEELIQRSKAGDSQAFEPLVERYYNSIYKLMFHFTGTVQDAEDLTQEAFLESYRCLPSFKGQSKFYTWLYRIATNLAMNHLRRRKSALSLDEMTYPPALPVEIPRGAMEKREFYQVLYRAIGSLTDEKKTVFVLREMHGLSYQEIAEVAGIKMGTVMSRLSRARNEVRETVEKHLE